MTNPALITVPCQVCGEPVPMDADLADEDLEMLCQPCFLEAHPDLAWMIPATEAAARAAVRTQLRELVELARTTAANAAA